MIDGIIVGQDNWSRVYKSKLSGCHRKTWIFCELNNGKRIYLLAENKVDLIKKYCTLNKVGINKVGLKYRSHEIELDEYGDDGYYIVKSVRGSMGSKTKHCIVLGAIKGGKVHKKAFITPELIVSYEDVDDIEGCFEEALIYNDQKVHRKK